MDFKDQIKQLGDRVAKMLPQIQTEEATKNFAYVALHSDSRL